MKSPESEKHVMKLLADLNYYSKNFPNIHVILAPWCTLLYDQFFQLEQRTRSCFLPSEMKTNAKIRVEFTKYKKSFFNYG